jgi:phenylacetate-CoA ligase
MNLSTIRLAAGEAVSPIFMSRFDAWFRADRWRAYRSLSHSQWLSAEELQRLQEERLRVIFEVARRTRWYSRLLPSPDICARHPRQVLADLPPLTHSDLQSGLDAISVAEELRSGAQENYTGGSMGAPLRLYQSPEYRAWGTAELYRDFEMCNGFRTGERRLFLWGSDVDSRDHAGLRGLLRDTLTNQTWVNAFGSADLSPERASAIVRRTKPRLVIGYVSTLVDIARSLTDPPSSIRGVQTAAEMLTPDHREVIERGFGARAYNRYGCREVGNIAHECDNHNGLHLLMENNLTEVVDEAGTVVTADGSEGLVTVTNLWNTATPLIRYQPGDIACLGETKCRCGRGAPKLATVVGKSADVIRTPGGRRLHGAFFTHLFYNQPVRRFRVEQTESDRLEVLVVPDAGYGDHVKRQICEAIVQHGDPAFVVSWREVEAIPAAPSGKFRFTVSRLQ